jgi:small neutral amino acid transporter SnatA (MarC family)
MRLHRGTLFAGVLYLMVAIVFMLEALDVWTLRIGDLRYIGPIALVLIGLAVGIGSLGRDDTQH